MIPHHIEKINKYNQLTKNKIDSKIFKDYILEYLNIDNEVTRTSNNLNKFPKTQMGLFSDEVRGSIEFKKADEEYIRAFKKLQEFNKNHKELNKYYNKHFPYILKEKLDLNLIN